MKFSRHTAVLFRAVPGYLALAHVDGTVSEVHGPGADVWDVLESPHEIGEVVEAVAERYGVAPEAIMEDVQRLLRDLERGGYVTNNG